MTLRLQDFIASWKASTRSERSGAQEHFLDLCQALGVPTPSQTDPTGEFYTFERRVTKTGGGAGFADVWRRGYFAWEYKGKHKNLVEAYKQLLLYRENLDNPPLLVVCDFYRFEVHTNFTNTASRVYEFTLDDLGSSDPLPGTNLSALAVLRAVLTEPERLRPQQTVEEVTEKIAAQFAELARNLQARGEDPERTAHFLMRLLFCLFAEDISNLLPDHLFTKLLENTRRDPASFNSQLRQLFSVMATGGFFGFAKIPYFNGGLFEDMEALDLTGEDMDVLLRASRLDWAAIEPAIFGTLFERSLDPAKRSQLGAHYTSKEDILLIVEPVLMEPLHRRWLQVQEEANKVIALRDAAKDPGQRTRRHNELARLLADFADELHAVRVLDPACGSGNFLYVALKRLLDLEKEVSAFGTANGLTAMMPNVDPSQLYGIELNPYAHELASVVVWIGYIQWLNANGFGTPAPPILRRLDNIKQMDAILAYDAEGKPVEPQWPDADVIIGNPPFLGGSKIRREFGDAYTQELWKLYESRVPAAADLVCYWFERARSILERRVTIRAGLIATQAIRASANAAVLQRIKGSGDIFLAWSDRPWVLDGASVRVSIVGFDSGLQQERVLDGQSVSNINADLTGLVDTTRARRLVENAGIAFMGAMPAGPFDIEAPLARAFLAMPLNVNGRTNADVVRPVVNAHDLVQHNKGSWTVDFGTMPIEEAAFYEGPFEHLKQHVYPVRQQNRRSSYSEK